MMEISDATFKLMVDALNQLGIATAHVYGVYVQAQIVLAIGNLVVYGSCIAAFVISFWQVHKYITTDDVSYSFRSERSLALFVSLAVAVVIAFVVLLIVNGIFEDVVFRIFCPEYTAIRDLLNKLANLT